MGPVGRRRAAALLAVLVLPACSSQESPTGSSSAPGGGGTPSVADPTSALRERCGSALPAEAELEVLVLEGPGGTRIEAARVGPGAADHVAVLLPQIGGICGWGRWAVAAQERGTTSLLVSPCGYGETTCTSAADADPLTEVAPAVGLAREEIGAGRVVLLGTSMGGSLTVMAVAAGADVDAWADVPFVGARDGHGWDLLVDPVEGTTTAVGERLMSLAEGPG